MHVHAFGADSLYSRVIPLGCRHCRRGAKMVLLITGKCNEGCFYCPLSERKKGKDVVFANELQVSHEEDVLSEALSIRASGTGITGGDPLCVPDRTLHYIRLLKETFGGSHHIHLYTSTIDAEKFQALERAGLDELRIHPMIEHWHDLEPLGIREAIDDLDMDIGFEVPCIPGLEKETRALIAYADSIGLDFVNLNELEFSETNAERLKKRGFQVKDDVSSAVFGSQELAVRLTLDDRYKVPVHYCSSSFKDKVQLRNRLQRRARNVVEDRQVVTLDGTLLKGIIETDRPEDARALLIDRFEVPADLIGPIERGRLEVAPWVLRELAPQLPWNAYQVEVYPTADHLEVEREPLNRIKVKKK